MRYLSMIFLLAIFVYAGESEAFSFAHIFKCNRFMCKNPVKAAKCMVESKEDGGGIAEKHPSCYKVILDNHEKVCNSQEAIKILRKIGIDDKRQCLEALKNARYKEQRAQHQRSGRR